MEKITAETDILVRHEFWYFDIYLENWYLKEMKQ